LALLKSRGIEILIFDHNIHATFRITVRACVIDEGESLMEDAPEKVAANRQACERFSRTEFAFGAERRGELG